MEYNSEFSKHYITADEKGRITNGFSDALRSPADTDICINERGSYQFRLFPGGRENPSLREKHGIPLYKYANGVVSERTEEEINSDLAELPGPAPSTEERVAVLEEQLAESDAVALALYEAQLEQETVIAEHDEAILGIYEMIGG